LPARRQVDSGLGRCDGPHSPVISSSTTLYSAARTASRRCSFSIVASGLDSACPIRSSILSLIVGGFLLVFSAPSAWSAEGQETTSTFNNHWGAARVCP